MKKQLSLKDIYQARYRIGGLIRKTPLVFSEALSEKTKKNVYLKLETVQETGSFKSRGAASKLLSLSEAEKKRGVIAFSTGNHGRAVAFMARRMGIKATICLSNRVPAYRVEGMRQLGAHVIQHGESQDEAYVFTLELREQEGLTLINPFDDPQIIAGQGTIGIEILEELPEVDTAIVPVSGGGLISGVALALKTVNPDIKIIGVSPKVSPPMFASLKAGKPVEIEEKDSLADALLGGIGLDNRYTFSMVRALVDDMVLVEEDDIARGMIFAYEKHRLVIEGSGGVGLSALLKDRVSDLGENIVVVVSGGNVGIELHHEIMSKNCRGEEKNGFKF